MAPGSESLPGQPGPGHPSNPQPHGLAPAVPHLVPHRFFRIQSEAAKHRQDLVGTVIHRVEVVGSSKAQDTRSSRWWKWVLSGPAEGGGEDSVSGLGQGRMGGKIGERTPECRVNTGPRTTTSYYFPEWAICGVPRV